MRPKGCFDIWQKVCPARGGREGRGERAGPGNRFREGNAGRRLRAQRMPSVRFGKGFRGNPGAGPPARAGADAKSDEVVV